MSEARYGQRIQVAGSFVAVDGGEIENQDIFGVGDTAGLAGDRVLAELLRLHPFDGFAAKVIVPFGWAPDVAATYFPVGGTVAPSFFADGCIRVNPFRAIAGSRVANSAATIDTPLQNWRDIRSAIYPPDPTEGTAIGHRILLAANSSGNPRWDLVYAVMLIEQPANPVTRRVKDPNSSVIAADDVYQYMIDSVSITVLAGTPGAPPTVPTIPADNPGVWYNFPLAAVRVPTGWDATHTVNALDIRDLSAPAPIHPVMGVPSIAPASGNNDTTGTLSTNFPWTGTTNQRPGPFLPPAMVGGKEIIVFIDAIGGSPSHPDGSIVDNSVNWTNRIFETRVQVSSAASAAVFGSDPTASAVVTTPANAETAGGFAQETQDGNSFGYSPDATFGAGLRTVVDANHGAAVFSSVIASGGTIGIYVDSAGVMRARIIGSPAARLYAWIRATAQFPNA